MHNFKRIWLLCLTFAATLYVSCDNQQEKQIVIAEVGKEKLTTKKMLDEIPTEIRGKLTNSDIREFVQRWVNSQVLYQEAKRQKLDERVDLKKEFEKVKIELMINRLIELSLEDEVQVTDKEIETFYDENKEDFVLNEDLVHAYHILVKTREEANAIRRRLRKGESFEEVSKEVMGDSTEPATWDLGYFSKDEVIPEISKVIFNMPSGALSLPIMSDYGYHIVKLIDKQKQGDYNKLENVQGEIKLKLEAIKKRERFQGFLSDLKNKTEIITNFQLLEKVNLNSIDKKEN